MNAETSRYANLRIRNAHMLEMAELRMAHPSTLTYPTFEPSLLAPGAPTDIVDLVR